MPSSVSSGTGGRASLREVATDEDARSVRSSGSTKSRVTLNPEAIPRSESQDDETASVRSSRSSASVARSTASSATYSSSTLSRSSSGSALRATGSSVATSVISLRDLESRKAEIELELQRVQRELEERQTLERRSRAERPLALLPATARITSGTSQQLSSRHDKSTVVYTGQRPHVAPRPGAQHR